MLSPSDGAVDVTTPRRRRPAKGIRWHSSSLPADEVTVHDGIPVTTVARTLLDLAAVATPHVLEEAMRRAEHDRYADSPSLAALVDRYPGRRGVAKLKAILGARVVGSGITREELERRFLRFLDRYGLPRPRLNFAIELPDRLVVADCAWPTARLIVELDTRSVTSTAR